MDYYPNPASRGLTETLRSRNDIPYEPTYCVSDDDGYIYRTKVLYYHRSESKRSNAGLTHMWVGQYDHGVYSRYRYDKYNVKQKLIDSPGTSYHYDSHKQGKLYNYRSWSLNYIK